MNSLAVAAWAWRGVGSVVFRYALWFPFLLLAAVQAVILGTLVTFYHPVLLPLALPLVGFLGGEGATHYPYLYYALTTMFDRVNLVVDVLLSSIAGGAATLLFAKAYGSSSEEPSAWKRALRCAPTLICATVLALVLVVGVAMLAQFVPRELMAKSRAVRWTIRGSLLVFYVVVQSFLAYTTAWIVLMGHRLWPAIRDSVRVTVRTLLPTLIVVGVPALIVFPFSYASSRTDLIAGKLRPEMVANILMLQVVLQALVTFALVGAVTRLFLWRVEADR